MAQKAGDIDSCASTLVNLGSALMSTDPDAAIESLTQAVALREAAVRTRGLRFWVWGSRVLGFGFIAHVYQMDAAIESLTRVAGLKVWGQGTALMSSDLDAANDSLT